MRNEKQAVILKTVVYFNRLWLNGLKFKRFPWLQSNVPIVAKVSQMSLHLVQTVADPLAVRLLIHLKRKLAR